MTLSDLANLGTFVSSVAVLASVVYLALQIRQSARNQRAVMDRGRSEQIGDWLQFIAGPDIAPLVLRGHADDKALSEDEHRRYTWCIYPLLLHFEDSFYQYRDGMLGDAQYESICNQMRDSAQTKGICRIWSEVRDRFPGEFRAFADPIFAGVQS